MQGAAGRRHCWHLISWGIFCFSDNIYSNRRLKGETAEGFVSLHGAAKTSIGSESSHQSDFALRVLNFKLDPGILFETKNMSGYQSFQCGLGGQIQPRPLHATTRRPKPTQTPGFWHAAEAGFGQGWVSLTPVSCPHSTARRITGLNSPSLARPANRSAVYNTACPAVCQLFTQV